MRFFIHYTRKSFSTRIGWLVSGFDYLLLGNKILFINFLPDYKQTRGIKSEVKSSLLVYRQLTFYSLLPFFSQH